MSKRNWYGFTEVDRALPLKATIVVDKRIRDEVAAEYAAMEWAIEHPEEFISLSILLVKRPASESRELLEDYRDRVDKFGPRDNRPQLVRFPMQR